MNIQFFVFNFRFLCDEVVGSLASFLHASLHIARFSLMGPVIPITDYNNNNNDGPSLLSAALQRHANIQHLQLTGIAPDYLAAIFDALGTNRSLQSLIVFCSDLSAGALASFQKLMRKTLTIRKLLVFCHGSLQDGTRDTLLKIAKRNFSLFRLCAMRGGDVETYASIFNDEDNRLLRFYANRNKRMDQWITCPASIPKHLHPEVLAVAAQAEPSVLFRSLLAISGDLAPTKRTRKRKRPASYKPA